LFEGGRSIQTSRERALKLMKKGDIMWLLGISRTPYTDIVAYADDFHKRRSGKGITCKYLFNEYAEEFARKSANILTVKFALWRQASLLMGSLGITFSLTINKGSRCRLSLTTKHCDAYQ